MTHPWSPAASRCCPAVTQAAWQAPRVAPSQRRVSQGPMRSARRCRCPCCAGRASWSTITPGIAPAKTARRSPGEPSVFPSLAPTRTASAGAGSPARVQASVRRRVNIQQRPRLHGSYGRHRFQNGCRRSNGPTPCRAPRSSVHAASSKASRRKRAIQSASRTAHRASSASARVPDRPALNS